MKLRRWHIKIEFDWDGYEFIDLNAVRIKLAEYIPRHWKNTKVEVTEDTTYNSENTR